MKNEQEKLHKDGRTSEWISSDLLKFSHHMLYQPSTLALIGEIDPASLEKDFSLFDKSFHYFFIPFPDWFYPWFFSRELQARTRLNESWRKNQNPPTASEFHRARLALLDNNSSWLSENDYGALLTGFFWASLGNTIPGVFWSLFYILRDAKALETIQQEMDTHLPKDEDWNPKQLDACVYLESAINESIRLVGAPFMTRKCIRQSDIDLQDGRTITLQTGENLAWFGGASHYDPNMFPQPTSFIFDRFLNKKADTVVGYMPFGGGKSICPGRFFAKYEIKTCIAMLLRYMEYKIDDTETIPSQLRPRIGVGIAPPNKDIPILYRYKV
jgi:cytochrome P450